MRAVLFLIMPFLMSACDSPNKEEQARERIKLNWEGEDEMLAEVCPERARDGFEFTSMQRVKMERALQYRYDGERIAAHFLPNTLYCSFKSKQGTKRCYEFFDVNISLGGGIKFCVDANGEVVDLELSE